MASVMPNPKQQYFDASGNPLNGGKVYTFAAGTITPKATYSNAAGSVANANPVVLNSRGEAVIFWSGTYYIEVKDSNDNLIYSLDNFSSTDTILASLAEPDGLSMIGGLNTFMTYPSENILGYGRNWFDIQVPDVDDFIDNVFSVQNKSTNGTDYGNAAIAFLDLAGTERGAMGYSRNNTIQPDGYYANTLYCEIGNPFTTDSDVTHFRVINTIKVGGPFWSGAAKSYFPIEVRADTGGITLDNGGGSAPILFIGSVIANSQFGVSDLSYGTPGRFSVAMTTTAARFGEYGAANQFALTSNVSNLDPLAITKDVAGGSAWKVEYGVGFDRFRISRCASGASTWTDFFNIGLDGVITTSGTYKAQIAPSSGWMLSVDDSLPVTVNNGATYNLAASSGIVMLNDYTGGQCAVFLCSAGTVILVSQTGTQYVSGAPGAGKVGLEWTGSVYRINNNKGSNTTFGVMTFASRQAV